MNYVAFEAFDLDALVVMLLGLRHCLDEGSEIQVCCFESHTVVVESIQQSFQTPFRLVLWLSSC